MQEFVWTYTCDETFERIRKALTAAPLLGHFDQGAPTTVTTGASKTVVGAVLSQKWQGKETVMDYASRALTAGKKKLHSNVWKCNGIHWAVTLKFCDYRLVSARRTLKERTRALPKRADRPK